MSFIRRFRESVALAEGDISTALGGLAFRSQRTTTVARAL